MAALEIYHRNIQQEVLQTRENAKSPLESILLACTYSNWQKKNPYPKQKKIQDKTVKDRYKENKDIHYANFGIEKVLSKCVVLLKVRYEEFNKCITDHS